MEILNLLQNLEKSETYIKWREENPDDYLVNLFKFVQDGADSFWQVGYYNKENDLITTFNIQEVITVNPPSEVFKKEDTIDKLNVELINIDSSKAIEIADNFQKANHPVDEPIKTIILLQNKFGDHVYNMTFVTKTMKTINVRISSVDGRIIDTKITNLIDFKQD